MYKFVVRRFLYMLLMIVMMSLLLFAMSRVRGDPRTLYMNEWSTEDDWNAWGEVMGLNRPLVAQYLIWMSKAVRGDFGDSILYAKPAISVVATRFPATLMLGGASFLFVLAVAVPLGVLSAVQRGSAWD
ncbi:MAG: ABC transporter permease, partial [Chloroflexi bacterium]|nr:ABC transporter permease [Chloroflexota bacterium]